MMNIARLFRSLFEDRNLECSRLQKENKRLYEKLMLAEVAAGHYKSERDIHFRETETFIRQAADKMDALSKDNQKMREALENIKTLAYAAALGQEDTQYEVIYGYANEALK